MARLHFDHFAQMLILRHTDSTHETGLTSMKPTHIIAQSWSFTLTYNKTCIKQNCMGPGFYSLTTMFHFTQLIKIKLKFFL
jgi:hypothetical protein